MTLVWIDFCPSCSSDEDGPEIPLGFIPSGVEGVGGNFGGSRFPRHFQARERVETPLLVAPYVVA